MDLDTAAVSGFQCADDIHRVLDQRVFIEQTGPVKSRGVVCSIITRFVRGAVISIGLSKRRIGPGSGPIDERRRPTLSNEVIMELLKCYQQNGECEFNSSTRHCKSSSAQN